MRTSDKNTIKKIEEKYSKVIQFFKDKGDIKNALKYTKEKADSLKEAREIAR